MKKPRCRRYCGDSKCDCGRLINSSDPAQYTITNLQMERDWNAYEIASLRELVKELREALHARVDGEGGTAAERALIAKADKATGDE